MKMSKGQTGRRLLGLAVVGMALAAGGAAFDELGQPTPWEYTLQESATPVMDNIVWFHNFLFWLITIITLFVLVLLVLVVVKFNAKANPVPSRTTHHTGLEVAWTPEVYVHHAYHASIGKLLPSGEYMRLVQQNQGRFEEKWGICWERHRPIPTPT